MTNKNFKQEACQVYIEQEIDVRLVKGKTPGEIGKELTKEVNALFEAAVKPDTIKKRAQRIKRGNEIDNTIDVGTNVPTSVEVEPSTSVGLDETPVSLVTQTSVLDKKKRYTLRLPPKLDKDIIEYRNRHNLKQAETFIQLLKRGLELEDVASKAVILSKDTGIGQSVAEVLDDIIEYYLYHVEQARLLRIETEQNRDKRTRNPINGLLE